MRFILLVFLVNIALFSWSQNSGLRGSVYDGKSDEILPGARIYDLNDKSIGCVASDNGAYSLALEPGKYQIICSMIGMEPDTLNVSITPGEWVNHDFNLGDDTEKLNVLVVSAGKFEQSYDELTVSMEVIEPSLIENKNTTSIESALEQAPGVTILDQEPQIRGGSGFTFGVGSRVAVVIDDMPLLTGDAGRPEWGFVPVENIAQIEVIKGASSVLYGSGALSGVINIRTAFPKSKPVTKFNYTTGVYSAPQEPALTWWNNAPIYTGLSFLHSRIINNNLDLVIGANLYYDHGYIGPPNLDLNEDTTIVDTLSNFTERQMAKYRARLNFNLRYRSEKVKGLSYGINGNGMISHSNLALAWQDDSVGLYMTYPGAVSLQDQRIFNLDPFIEYLTSSGVKHALRTRLFVTDNQITNNQSNSSTVMFGEYQLSRKFQYIPDFNFTGGVTGSKTISNALLYAGSGQAQNQVQNAAGYAQLDKKLWKALSLSAGLRFEYFKMNDQESVVKPVFRTGFSLKVKKGTTVRASHGQGFRYPTIAERFILTNAGSFGVFPNPNLEPETSTNSEIGIKQGFKFGRFMGYLDVAGFHQEYHNTIEYLFGPWDTQVALMGFKFLNTGDTRVRGFDISIMGITDTTKDFGVRVYGGYTFLVPVNLNPSYVYDTVKTPSGAYRPFSYNLTSHDTTDYILKYRFQHTGKIDIEFTYKKWLVGYSGRLYGPMRNIDAAFGELELLTGFNSIANIYYTDYFEKNNGYRYIHDVRLAYKINEKMRFSLVINNLDNKLYSLRPMKIEAPRSTAIQFIYKL